MDSTRGRNKYAYVEKLRGELGSREALCRLALYLRPLWRVLLLAAFFTMVWSVVNLGYGWLAKKFLDTIGTMANSRDMRQLNYWTVVGMGAFLLRGVLYFAYNYTWSYAAQRLAMRLRNELFGHFQQLPVAFFDHRKTGQLMSAISNDIPAVNTVLAAIQDSISAPILAVGGVAVLFYLNWPLALVSCTCLPLTVAIIARATRKTRGYSAQVQASLSQITEHAEETIAGIRVVKAFGNEAYERDRFDRRSNSVFRSVLRTLRTRHVMVPLVELLGAISIILVLWVGGRQIIFNSQSLTFGDLTFFVMVLQQVATGAKNLGAISVNLAAAGVAADRVFTLLDVQSDIRDRPDAIELRRVDGEVRFDKVAFAYSPGIPVLSDISFTVAPGEVVAIVGPTGAGKSTIASLIPRLYEASEGSIRIDGIDVRDCSLASLRRQIGIVPQETVLFEGTLRENIAYGRLGATDAEVIEAAKQANAWEFIQKLPDGLETEIGERGTRLSGGQRQRIAIARAILRDPRILILDEATSSLDVRSEALVQDALQKLVAHRTTVVIAHRLSTIRKADKILVIKDGQIVESGRHDDLLTCGGVYSELYRTQFRWADDPPRRGPFEP